jgi:hypothetical protein
LAGCCRLERQLFVISLAELLGALRIAIGLGEEPSLKCFAGGGGSGGAVEGVGPRLVCTDLCAEPQHGW